MKFLNFKENRINTIQSRNWFANLVDFSWNKIDLVRIKKKSIKSIIYFALISFSITNNFTKASLNEYQKAKRNQILREKLFYEIINCYKVVNFPSGDYGAINWLDYICNLKSQKLLMIHFLNVSGINQINFSDNPARFGWKDVGWVDNQFSAEFEKNIFNINLNGINTKKAFYFMEDPTFYGRLLKIDITSSSKCYLNLNFCDSYTSSGEQHRINLINIDNKNKIIEKVINGHPTKDIWQRFNIK